MKRCLASVAAVALAILATLGISVVAPAQAGVDDFTFDSMTATHEISRTSSGGAQMRVVETLVAQFPEADQNHGIIRAIPTSAHDRPVCIELVGVTDGDGIARDYTTNETGGFLEVTVAAPDFVHGPRPTCSNIGNKTSSLSRAAAAQLRSSTGTSTAPVGPNLLVQ